MAGELEVATGLLWAIAGTTTGLLLGDLLAEGLELLGRSAADGLGRAVSATAHRGGLGLARRDAGGPQVDRWERRCSSSALSGSISLEAKNSSMERDLPQHGRCNFQPKEDPMCFSMFDLWWWIRR
jgi:hypothetical protein